MLADAFKALTRWRLVAVAVLALAMVGSRALLAANSQTITFPAIGLKQTTSAPFTLGATASSGLTVSYTIVGGSNVAGVSGNTVTLTGATGAVTVKASQAGGGGYAPAADVYLTFGVLSPLVPFTQQACVGDTSIGVRTDGTLWEWGSTNTVSVPTQIGTDTHWKLVTGGSSHILALKTDGTLWAWGSNGLGQLGDGTTTNQSAPEQIGTATDWSSIGAGDNHSFAIKTNGTLWAWGNNANGQLGNGTTTQQDAPGQIGSATNWKMVCGGSSFTMALRTNGTLWGWGINNDGQLGDGTETQHTTPEQIGVATDWSFISTGASYTNALKSGGTLWGWGESNRQLVPTQLGTATNWQSIAAGYQTTYGLQTNGTLWSWGSNGFGNLGVGTITTAFSTLPAQVGTGSNWSLLPFSMCEANHVLVVQADGTLWAWGWNRSGQLGYGPRRPGVVDADTVSWVSCSAGADHSLGLKSDGSLWAWGNNGVGEIGDGAGGQMRKAPVQVSAGTQWQAVSAGDEFTLAIAADGSLWTCGENNNGQLGNGTTTSGGTTSALTKIAVGATWKTVSAGSNHSLAVKSDGTLWAWGLNSNGQLGDGTTTQQTSPEQIGTDTHWKTVAAGEDHSLALKTDGSLWAWGLNSSGELGDGTSTQQNAPEPIAVGSTWQSVSGGGFHTVAIRSDGTLWIWGSNANGQIGDSTNTTRLSPVPIAPGSTWLAAVAGHRHTVAIRSDGTLWAWGIDQYGQLGDGAVNSRNSPIQVGSSNGWRALCTGGGGQALHTLAIDAAGGLWGFGSNGLGQLGPAGLDFSQPQPVLPGESPQTLLFPAVSIPAYNVPVALSATTSNGMPVNYRVSGPATLSGNQLTVLSPGPVSVIAYQSGDLYWDAGGPVMGTLLLPIIGVQQPVGTSLVSGTSSVNFGFASISAPNGTTLNFTLLNNGTANLSSIAATIDGANASDFSITTSPPNTLGAGTNATFTLSFLPGSTGTRTARLHIASNDLSFNPFNITLTGTGLTPADNWRQQYFGSTSNTGNAADLADPNNNGIPNLIEYALNGDPLGNTTGTNILPQVSSSPSGTLQLTFNRYLDRTDLTLIVQANDALTGTWTNLAQSVNGAAFTVLTTGATVNESPNGNTVTVTVGDLYLITDPAHSHRFMRLLVIGP